MIKTNDLRFTNWVIFNGEYKQAKYVFFSDSNPFKNNELKVEPIPLTPEILEKCGFKKDESFGSPDFRFYENRSIDKKTNWAGIFFKDNQFLAEGSEGNFGIPILYLHQLQNLYHALTGEELIINL